jgi:hypothetical protein
LEVDFSAIEAKLTGWCARDPEFIRLASLGVHGAVASHILGKPYDPRWSDADLLAYFGEIKASNFPVYDRAKRAVYGDLYGQTAYGMMMTFQESFPTLKIATQYKAILHAMAPTVPKWQNQVRERAYQQNFLGGPGDHPFGYKHWFWSVLGFRAIPEHVYRKRQRLHEPCAVIQGRYYAVVLGEDAKRCVAFYPQSIAAAILKEALLRLFEPDSPSYIGDAYFGRTPLRAPIHRGAGVAAGLGAGGGSGAPEAGLTPRDRRGGQGGQGLGLHGEAEDRRHDQPRRRRDPDPHGGSG